MKCVSRVIVIAMPFDHFFTLLETIYGMCVCTTGPSLGMVAAVAGHRREMLSRPAAAVWPLRNNAGITCSYS
jgi:hypothetical protein